MDFSALASAIVLGDAVEIQPAHATLEGEHGLTLLHIASLHSRPSVAAKLLKHGAKVGSKTKLMLMNAPGVRFMRAGSATFYARDNNPLIPLGGCFDKGSTPLHMACALGDVELVRLLLENKGKPNLLNGVGATSIHLGSVSGNPRVIPLLLARKPRLHAKTKTMKSAAFYDAGMTAMLCALEAGNTEVVDLLAQAGCVYTDVSKNGYDAIYFAARGGHPELISRALTAMEAQSEAPNDEPLLNAIDAGSVEGVRLLISSSLFDPKGRAAPLYRATKLHRLEIRQQLLDAGMAAIQYESVVDAARNNDTTYLHAFEGNLDAVFGGRTALMSASAQGHMEAVELLIKRGVNINLSPDGTALHWAISRNKWEVVDRILEAGPDCSVSNELGAQPLFWLMLRTDTKRAVRALELGADPHLKTVHGLSPMDMAKRDGLREYVALFEAIEDKSSHLYKPFREPEVSQTLTNPPTASWRKLHGLLWDELVPPNGPCKTVQGELVRCIGRLTNEAYGNGNMNFDERHRAWIIFIESTLRNGAFSADWEVSVKRNCQALRKCRTLDLSKDGSPHYLLNEAVVTWCLKHPDLLIR